jgi:N-acetylmuramoyl-L-alanine amidase
LISVLSATSRRLFAVALAFLTLAAAPSADQKKISIYSSVAAYSLPVVDRAGHEYVGLLEILEPLGRVSGSTVGRRWRLRYNNLDCDFTAGRVRGRIRGRDFDLPAPFLIENSRGLVPLSSLGTLLPQFLGNPVNFHEAARRLFIGDVATRVSTQFDPGTPPRLVLNFTAPVNPTIATEPGKLRMVFAREPLVLPPNPSLSFDNQVITQATFFESNGAAQLDVTAAAPLMARFSNNGRTIMVAAAASAEAVPPAPTLPEPVPNTSTQPPSSPGGPPLPGTSSTRLLAIVDPAHGGNERGAALTDTLEEKTVTLGFARLLRAELQRQGFSVLLLREGDETLTLDQRAGTANGAHASVYISLHAGSQGSGVRVYTAIIPPARPDNGPFRDWNTAQMSALPVSQSVATAILNAMQRNDIPARGYSASLRPLNNLTIPAIAVELGPGPNGIADLPSANYQQRVAAAIADGVASIRDRLGVQP